MDFPLRWLNIKGAGYYKHREYFPNIVDCNDIFIMACDEYAYSDQQIDIFIDNFKAAGYTERIVSLYCMFLFILDGGLDESNKEKVKNLKFQNTYEERDKYSNEKLMYLYIMNYINNNLPKL